MKKALSFIVLAALVLSVVSSGLTPVAAAAPVSLAAIVPANASIYAEVDTRDIPGTVKMVVDLLSKAGMPLTSDMLFKQIDQSLTRAFGRPATFEKDILPWVGDSIALGARANFDTAGNPGNAVIVVSVKDDAALKALLDELVKMATTQELKITQSADKVGDQSVAVYTWNAGAIAVWKGYWVYAANDKALGWLLDNLKAKGATLAADAKFQKVNGLFKANSLAKLYVSGEFMQTLANAQMASVPASMKELREFVSVAYGAIQGLGFALRSSDKIMAIDMVEIIDPAAQKKAMDTLGLPKYEAKSIAAKLADRIPANALAVIFGSDLSGMYNYFREAVPALMPMLGRNMPGMRSRDVLGMTVAANAVFATIESSLKTLFKLDLNADVLSLMKGEFALYLAYNKNSDLVGVPLDLAALVEAADAKKATALIDKVNAGLPQITSTEPTKAGDNLYTLPLGRGLTVGYGFANNTLILSNGSGLSAAANAARGDGVLSTSPAWKRVVAEMGGKSQMVAYLNLAQINAMLKELIPATMIRPGSQDEMALKLLDLFESAVLYGSSNTAGVSTATAALILK